MPRYTGGSTIARVPMTRLSSSRSVIFWSVSGLGTSWSNRSRPSSDTADGTIRTRTDPASVPSPAATARTRATSGAASRASCS